MQITFEKLQSVLMAKGYDFFDAGDYHLNLIGVRNTRQLHANTFNDVFCVAYRVKGKPVVRQYACTTDAGNYYRENPINPQGTAILPPGQYHSMWRLGLHRGKYEALVQACPAVLIRDNNRDSNLDMNARTGVRELAGINCHRARADGTSTQVDKWSAGCQVIANSEDFAELMDLAKLCEKTWYPEKSPHRKWGMEFTYTLLEETDLAATHF